MAGKYNMKLLKPVVALKDDSKNACNKTENNVCLVQMKMLIKGV